MKTLDLLSERLKLRLIDFADLNAIHELHSLSETDRFNSLGIPKNMEVTKDIINPQIKENQQEDTANYTFAIEDLNEGTFLGLLGFRLGSKKYNNAEIWYKINVTHWGKGYATEAVNSILNFGFNSLHLHRISAGCAVDNTASFKVLEKAGMLREGISKELIPLKTGWSDCYEYGITEMDYKNKFSN